MISRARQIITHNWPAIAICLLISLVAAALWLWSFNTHYFNRRDAYDYAQLSRQVFRAEGLSTLQIFPRHIPYFHERGLLAADHWPNLYRNPLVTVTSVPFQFTFDSPVVAMVIQSGFWYLVCVPMLFFLARQLTSMKVAVLSTVFFVSDPVIFLYSFSGMTETLATFLLLSFFALALFGPWYKTRRWSHFDGAQYKRQSQRTPLDEAQQTPVVETPVVEPVETQASVASHHNLFTGSETWRLPLLGVVTALAYLARTQFIVLIPLALLIVWADTPKGKRTSSLVLFLLGLSLPLIPWSVRNLRVAGDPLFSFTTTRNLVLDAIPGHSDLEMQLHAPVDLWVILRNYGPAIAGKLFRNMAANILSPLYWANTFRRMFILLPLFAFVGIFSSSARAQRRYNFLKWSTLGLILATFVVISLTVYSVRSFVMFRPLLLIIGSYALTRLLDGNLRRPRVRIAIYALLILLAAYQLTSLAVEHKNSTPPISQFDQRTYEILSRKTGEDALIASDISEQISLFAERRTLRLPADPEDLFRIDGDYIPVDFVLLSRNLSTGGSVEDDDPGYHETYHDYVAFTASPEFLDLYSLEERLPNGSVLYRKVAPDGLP